jgi:general secretion pathway protein M
MNSEWLKRLMALPDKDRQRLKYLALGLFLSLLWFWNIAPALKTYREAPQQLAQLELQSHYLKSLQTQAVALQKAPRMNAQNASAALQQTASEILGSSAKLNVEAGRATLNLTPTSADTLAQFLASARIKAYALPVEAQLQKTKTADQELWRGTLILSLPTQ